MAAMPVSLGLLAALALGLTPAAHGFSKFSGPEGLAGTAGMFERGGRWGPDHNSSAQLNPRG